MPNSAVPIGTLISEGGDMSFNTMNSNDPSPKTVIPGEEGDGGHSNGSTPSNHTPQKMPPQPIQITSETPGKPLQKESESGSKPERMSFSGSTFKLLKACNFCRKRKIKCTVLRNNNACESCKEHDRTCVFDHKVINRDKSKVSKSILPKSFNVKAKISESITNNSKNLSSYTGTFLDQIDSFAMEEYNKSVNSHDIRDDLAWNHPNHPNITEDTSSSGSGTGHNTIPTSNNSPLVHEGAPTHFAGIDNAHANGNYQQPNGKNSFKTYSGSKNAIKESYITHIEPYTPFLSLDVFENDLDTFSKCCINIAAISSLNNRLPESAANFFLDILTDSFNGPIDWNETKLSCFFLLPQRLVVPKKVIRDSLKAFNDIYTRKMANNEPISLNLVAGALCVDAWYALFNESKLITDVSISKKCYEIFKTMDISAFNYQFVNVNIFLYKLIWLIDASISAEEKKDELIRFEFNMLLFPAKLSKNLIVVKDTLLATPEAFILHILHDMLMITYYTRAVTNPEYGEMTSILAVPGLYHFISGMAISNFRVTEEIAGRWSVISDCQIYTAKLLLQLYNVMEFDTFTFTLQFYNRRSNSNFDELESTSIDNAVKDFLNSNAVRDRDDDFDGAVVFWVFRDVRSMSLQLYINDRKRRGSEASDATL